LDPTFPPFEATNGQDIWGLDVDLSNEIAADLELETAFVNFGYDGLYDALATEQVDILVSALVITPERTRDFSYTRSYFDAGQVILSANESDQIQDIEELSGLSLGVELGAQGHVLATTWQRQIPGILIQPYPTLEELNSSLITGEIDIAVVDHVSARVFKSQHPKLVISELRPLPEPFAIVVRADDEELLEVLNESINKLDRSGKLEMLITKWLD
jgi:polar amino acid transport system substrate-binding protein